MKKEEIKAVIFDIGGVLLENPLISEFWKNCKGSKQLRNKFGAGKMPKQEFINKASKMLNIPKRDFIKEYGKAYFPIKKIKEVYKIYKKIKIKKTLFSDTNPIHLKFIKKKYPEIFDIADAIFMSSISGSRKNQLVSYKHIISKLQFRPSQMLVIDDKQDVLDLARRLGMKTILFKNNKQLIKNLKKLGVRI